MIAQTDNNSITPDGSIAPSNSSSGSKTPWLCLLGGVGVFALVYFMPWSLVGQGVNAALLALFSVAFHDPKLTTAILVTAIPVGICILWHQRNIHEATAWDKAAVTMIILSACLGFIFFLASTIFRGVPNENSYRSAMLNDRTGWDGVVSGPLVHRSNRFIFKEECQQVASMNITSSHTSLSINGLEPTASACNRSVNAMVWQKRPSPVGAEG